MLKSPLLHFFVIAFITYAGLIGIKKTGWVSSLSLGEGVNVITLNQAELIQIYKGNSDKQSEEKLAASINTLVDNELLFREGLKLGLASNDALIIDRMVKNIEYISEQQVNQKKCTTLNCVDTSERGLDRVFNDADSTLEAQSIDEALLSALFEEAKSLNLFENDPVIYRRVIQLAEQHLRRDRVIEKPIESELRAYISRNSSDFLLPKRWSLEHVYFDPSLHPEGFNAVLNFAFEQLSSANTNANNIGDVTILPKNLVLASERQLVQQFGSSFAKAVADAPLDKWSGPFKSSFGSHFIRVGAIREQSVAELGDVYNRAFLGWLEEQKRNAFQDQIGRLRGNYSVSVDGYETVAATDFSRYWMNRKHDHWQSR